MPRARCIRKFYLMPDELVWRYFELLSFREVRGS
jgi:hypothetical protein